MHDDILESEIDRKPRVLVNIEGDDVKTVHVTGVRFKASGKVYYFSNEKKLDIKDGMNVIVDTARGLEFGEVAFADCEVKETSIVPPVREIVRVATDEDAKHHADNKRKEDEAFKICLEKIQKHELDMKLIEAQYSFDNSKLLFYFTSASRVDFRELVKDLAATFRTRIELRQIGIRDEAKLMGGLGVCGRPLCCSTFLPDFVQVSIRMAKEQNLSLNSGKISGLCGRLMCCLQYEYSTYAEETAKTPPVDSVVKTANGVGFVTETNPLAGTIKVRLKDKPDTAPELYKREDVTLISRPSKNNDDKD
ncbi:MAG: stage 0 sporulation protein [Ruminococcaceae bacterium]|nr:stage 0 sporulation protein [Oscillospiraceae bacterium]